MQGCTSEGLIYTFFEETQLDEALPHFLAGHCGEPILHTDMDMGVIVKDRTKNSEAVS